MVSEKEERMSSWLGKRFGAMRAFALPVSVLPVLVATAAVREPGEWHWGVLIASMLGAAFLHVAGNLFNDYFDFKSGVDRKVAGDENRPGRQLVRGELTPKDILTEAAVFVLLTLLVGGYLVWQCGGELLWFAGAAFASIYWYTGPPFKMKYRALGEPLIFLVFGPILMLGAGYAQTGKLEWLVLLLSVPVGLATTAILTANNIRDQEEDQVGGIRTLAQVIGIRALRWFYILLVAGCVLFLAVLGVVGLGLGMLVCAPILLVLLAKPLKCVWGKTRLPDIDAQTARFASVMLVFLLVALLLR